MKCLFPVLALLLYTSIAPAQDFKIHSFELDGQMTLTNTFPMGIVTVEGADSVLGPWRPRINAVSTSSTVRVEVDTTAPTGYFRAVARDLTPGVPNGRPGFTNLINSYGLLTTIAGAGNRPGDGVNNWLSEYEFGPATNAELSRPHIAMADDSGNIYIADKWGFAIRKVSPDGIIVTVAGTGQEGNGPDTATIATQSALSRPNGLFVKGDGTYYILDLGNSKIRRVDTNGMMTTILFDIDFINVGRGLWVAPDESEVYYSAGREVRKWTPSGGISVFTYFTNNFNSQLGNLTRHPITGDVIVTDRGGNAVWRVETDGGKALIAGNETTFGGGDGQRALETGLHEVRTAAFLPTGGYFLGTHRAGQMWYVDTDGYIHLFVNGDGEHSTHAGDGTWFYNPFELRMSEIRAVTIDSKGNLIICEHDSGYIRKIEFLPFLEED